MRCVLVTLWLFSAGAVAAPQDSSPGFAVASIKPNRSGEAAASTLFPPGGRFSARNASLRLLIRLAYGVADYQISDGPDWIRSDRFDVEAKSAFLTQILDRPVIDQTGLNGLFGFDFALPSNILPSPDSSESIFEAIQDQLGLRLERAKGPIDVLVIDGVDRLSEN